MPCAVISRHAAPSTVPPHARVSPILAGRIVSSECLPPVGKLGGVIQLTPVVDAGLELGPKGRKNSNTFPETFGSVTSGNLPFPALTNGLPELPLSMPVGLSPGASIRALRISQLGSADDTSPSRLSRTDALLLPSSVPFQFGVRLPPRWPPPSGRPPPPPRRRRPTLCTTPRVLLIAGSSDP
ncbi:hypothetical protein T02_14076 [Trichinella nativa]|uniref:Uncharacterized protein n=1 Tax=Trichinella nativa TaxID=6335 RepID=A0A0V1KPA6_9BILA|nr:hypothetical protein T02_14076 [Trichinella nativa]